jgi:hypothetical protein
MNFLRTAHDFVCHCPTISHPAHSQHLNPGAIPSNIENIEIEILAMMSELG